MKTLTPFIFYQISSPCLEHDRNNAGYFIFSTGHIFGNWEVTVPESYGITLTPRKILKFALRTSTTTTTMRTTFTRMVTSTAAAVWVGIPAGGALRTSASTTMRASCFRMVTSTTATIGMSTIPAGVNLSDHRDWVL